MILKAEFTARNGDETIAEYIQDVDYHNAMNESDEMFGSDYRGSYWREDFHSDG